MAHHPRACILGVGHLGCEKPSIPASRLRLLGSSRVAGIYPKPFALLLGDRIAAILGEGTFHVIDDARCEETSNNATADASEGRAREDEGAGARLLIS